MTVYIASSPNKSKGIHVLPKSINMNIKDVNKDGIAFDGMDPVAYHTGEPLPGNERLRHEWDGVIYLFVNEKNMRKFQEDPAKYTGPLQGKVGRRSAVEHRNLEEKREDRENNVPLDIKEDGNVEMQNLSDSQK